MIVQDGDRLRLSGDLTLSTVSGLLDAGRAGVAAGDCIVDLADVGRVDSAALALLFAWLRAARAAGIPVRFFAADMNHALARDKARAKGLPEPVDFRGAAHGALAKAR